MKRTYTLNEGTNQKTANLTHNAQLNFLVESHIGLVTKQAKYVISRNRNYFWLTESDLLSAGYEALWNAALAYNPACEASFSTYATCGIRNEMVAEIKRMFPIRVSDEQRKDIFFVRDEVDDSELANPRPSAFDQFQSECMDCNWGLEEQSLREKIDEAMEQLLPEERTLVRRRYGFDNGPMTLKELSEIYNISLQAISKRQGKIHDKLRTFIVDECHNLRRCA